MRRSHLLLPLTLVVAALAGCGNKGPLVLPPPRPSAPVNAPLPAAPATPAIPASSALPGNGQH